MELLVYPTGVAVWGDKWLRCALGRSGVRTDKREGDGATPAGLFAFRRVLFRADRIERPATLFECGPIGPHDGWCDDPAHPDYNRPVPYGDDGIAEPLWRDDHVYDLIVVIGHNDDPVEPDKGSAIFLHVATDDYAPTEGCIAMARDDLIRVLATAQPGDTVRVQAP